MVSKLKLQENGNDVGAILNGNSEKDLVESGETNYNGMVAHLDLKQKIGVTKFSVGYVIRSLQGKDDKWDHLMAKRKLQRIVVTQIAGIGYLSYIYRIQFHFDDVSQPFSAILKVPTVMHIPTVNPLADDLFLTDFALKLAERHDKEIYFYENFSKRIRHVKLASMYNSRTSFSTDSLENACVLMEDLGIYGVMPSVPVGLTKLQVEALIKAIAEIHAISLSVPHSAELIEKLRFTSSLDQEDGQAKNAAVENLLKLPHDYFRRHKKALERAAKENEIMVCDSHKEFGTPPVLCHGDFWSNNVFFEANPDGSPSDELYAIFDWQFAHPSTGLIDIVRLILICVNASLKLRFLDDWLRLYYECFSDGCRRHGVRNPYTMDLVRKMFRYQYPSEMLFSYIILLNYFGRIEDEGIRTALLGRMISSFELVRRDFQ
ncbi:ecdysteroid kinase domain-containing protein [Ditylenchus destructor]|nr:ecdysteroid kinase domain-containing protein [Ditylenchus destructor]